MWTFDPTPFAGILLNSFPVSAIPIMSDDLGDMIVTIIIQTFLTYLISGFLISKDLGMLVQ
jgi:hypothetical protein